MKIENKTYIGFITELLFFRFSHFNYSMDFRRNEKAKNKSKYF